MGQDKVNSSLDTMSERGYAGCQWMKADYNGQEKGRTPDFFGFRPILDFSGLR